MPRLTQTKIDRAAPKKKDYWLSHDQPRGLNVRVWPSGTKQYVLRYTMAGRQRATVIGDVREYTLREAEDRAYEIKRKVREGIDPAKERPDQVLFREFTEVYLRDYARPRLRPNTLKQYERYLKRHILPRLGKLDMEEIEGYHLEALHVSLKDTPVHANRVMNFLSRMLSVAEKLGYRPINSNPAPFVERYKEKPRRRYLSEDEYRNLLLCIGGWEDKTVADYILLLLLTGARKDELRTLRWDQVDLEGKRLVLDHAKETDSEKDIELMDMAVELLARRREGNRFATYVFEGDTPHRPMGDPYYRWDRLRKAAGIPDVHLHDLRHTFATIGLKAGVTLKYVGALLGHSKVQTTERYAHVIKDPKREALNKIEAAVADMMAPQKGVGE